MIERVLVTLALVTVVPFDALKNGASAFVFDKGTPPSTFRVGSRYPNLPEATVCRGLQTHISRDSDRFRTELVTNVDPAILFATPDARIMSSRMQSKLGLLKKSFTGSFTVLKAWAEYPDPNISDIASLHYDGRSVQVRVSDTRRISEFLLIAATTVGFDWVEYTSAQYVRLSVIPTVCVRNSDIVFILDASGSIGSSNFQKVIKFLSDVVSYFNIAPNATRVGLVQFSTTSTKVFSLNRYLTLRSLQSAIGQITYTQGWTATGLGLLDALDMLNVSKPYGARPLAEGVPRTAVLITDGYSNRGPSVATVAPLLKNLDINVYVVGVGSSIRRSELELIASDPSEQYVYIINSYSDAEGFVNLLSFTACDTPACVTPGDDISGMVPGDDIIHYCSKCPAFSRTVIVQVTDIGGKSHLYASGRMMNPGPLTNPSLLYKNESIDGDSRLVRVNIDDTLKTVFVGVKGHRRLSQFTIFISDNLFRDLELSIFINDSATGIVINSSFYLLTQIKSNTLRYTITSGNINNDFSIDGVSGAVKVVGNLNGVSKPVYNLVIIVRNVTMPCHQARLHVQIRVRRSSYIVSATSPASIPENTPIGTPVARITIAGGTGSIAYSIVAGNSPPTPAFAIDSTGWILVNGLLNYEARQSYNLTVRLASTATQATATVTQIITITDVNEAPYFTTACAVANTCVGRVYENMPNGTEVNVTVFAMDPDFAYLANGMLSYSLQPSGLPFRVSATGTITTIRPLDRESISSYTFTVTVADHGTPPLNAVTTVRVEVLDVNDNPPIIAGPTSLQAREDAPTGSVLASYTATDADIGVNAVIQFVLVPITSLPSLPLSVNITTGSLTLRSTLSFQMNPLYNFRVVARNPDGLNGTNSTLAVTLRVVATNNNPPVFVRAPYTASVQENTPVGTAVNVTILATDADSGTNGVVRYVIVQGNTLNSFSLNPTTGQLSVSANIDREAINRFFLVVRAYDLGFPSRSATATVNVTVLDVNDNPPVFDPARYAVTVRESVAVGTLLATVSATDRDEPGTPNSQFDYSISSPTMFGVSPNGSVWLREPFNYSVASFHSLVLTATDHGTPPLSGTATFVISLINDHPAVIRGNRSVTIPETTRLQTVVSAYSPPGTGTFSIQSGNVENTFAINIPTEGSVTLVQALDYNVRSQYVLAVTFRDASTNITSVSYLTVFVTEVNKYPPVFLPPHSFFVEEERPSGTLLGFLNVTDADKGPLTSKVTLTLQGPLAAYFALDPNTGRLTTSARLDREALVGFFPPPSSMGLATVLAQDAGTPPQQSVATITVVLGDINDNTPIIADTTATVSIVEEVPTPFLIFDVSATDPDLGSNGTVRYLFVSTPAAAGLFGFPSNDSGLLNAEGRLDREQQEQYTFSITVYDLGTPSLSTVVSRSLTLLDINDNAPTFSQSPYRVKVSDGVSLTNRILIQVTANDPDKGNNGTVQYSLNQALVFLPESIIEPAILVIDSTTGNVTTSTTFLRSAQPQISAVITGTDLGNPSMMSSVILIVDVTSSPVFDIGCSGSTYENSPVGTFVARCNATLQGDVGPLVYAIQSAIAGGPNPNMWVNLFQISSSTGSITVASPIDREAFHNITGSNSLTLTVSASDGFNPPMTTTIAITILDVNDNAPVFTLDQYSVTVNDASIAAQVTNIIVVSATDRDEGTNALVTYSILEVNEFVVSTSITIQGQDSAPPAQQLRSSVNLTISFQSQCYLQTYSVGSNSGQVTATLLCAATVTPAAANLTLGGSLSLTCSVLANTPLTYQWIQNTTNIDPVTSGAMASLNIVGASFSSAGQYGCEATSAAGTLRSGSSAISIQVAPVITEPPSNVAVQLGMPTQFTCVATGIPSPTISWLRNGVPYQGPGSNSFQLSSSQLSDQMVYTCVASNSAGTAQASANLTIIDPNNVVGGSINNITNPVDGNCHFFNISAVQSIISSATGLTVVFTNVSGDLLCVVNACVPNPCQNGATCVSNNDSSYTPYTCICAVGFTGMNCEQYINYCQPSNPCLNGGTCTSVMGSLQCTCPPGITGDRCQYVDVCASMPCGPGEYCLPTNDPITRANSRVCEPAFAVEGIIVTVVPTSSGVFLDNQLSVFAQTTTTTSGKKRRQASAQDPGLIDCESRFVPRNGSLSSELVLLWICPPGVQRPTNATLSRICGFLLQNKLAQSCYSPASGTQLPTPPTVLGGVNVGINFVLLSASGVPLSSQEAITVLTSSGALSQLQQSGFKATSFMPVVSTTGTSTTDLGGLSVGAIVGIVVGAVIGGLLLVALVVFLISVLVITKRRKEAIQSLNSTGRGYVIQLADVKMGTLSKGSGSKANLLNNEGNEYDSSKYYAPYQLNSPTSPPPVIPPKPVETPFVEGRASGTYENVLKPAAV